MKKIIGLFLPLLIILAVVSNVQAQNVTLNLSGSCSFGDGSSDVLAVCNGLASDPTTGVARKAIILSLTATAITLKQYTADGASLISSLQVSGDGTFPGGTINPTSDENNNLSGTITYTPLSLYLGQSNCGPDVGFRCVFIPVLDPSTGLFTTGDYVWMNITSSPPSNFIQFLAPDFGLNRDAFNLKPITPAAGFNTGYAVVYTDPSGMQYTVHAYFNLTTYRGCTSGKGAHCGTYLRVLNGRVDLTPQ